MEEKARGRDGDGDWIHGWHSDILVGAIHTVINGLGEREGAEAGFREALRCVYKTQFKS